MEELVTCVFDKSHQIRLCRYKQHLLKCQKNHPDVSVSTCPYDANHVIRDELFNNHLQTCDKKIYGQRTDMMNLRDVPFENVKLADVGEEDWGIGVNTCGDNEIPANCQILFRPIYRPPPNQLSKLISQRYRNAEIQRIRRLENRECILDIAFPVGNKGETETIQQIINRSRMEINGINIRPPSPPPAAKPAAKSVSPEENILATASTIHATQMSFFPTDDYDCESSLPSNGRGNSSRSANPRVPSTLQSNIGAYPILPLNRGGDPTLKSEKACSSTQPSIRENYFRGSRGDFHNHQSFSRNEVNGNSRQGGHSSLAGENGSLSSQRRTSPLRHSSPHGASLPEGNFRSNGFGRGQPQGQSENSSWTTMIPKRRLRGVGRGERRN